MHRREKKKDLGFKFVLIFGRLEAARKILEMSLDTLWLKGKLETSQTTNAGACENTKKQRY